MNAADTIQAAIDKLEGLRNESFYSARRQGGSTWVRQGASVVYFEANDEDFSPWGVVTAHRGGRYKEDGEVQCDEPTSASLDLIVTQHRTIDVQIAILTRSYNMRVMGREDSHDDLAVMLAKAILGES